MFIKINTKNKQKLAINKFFHLLPPVLLGFATLIFSITTLLFSQIKTFAAPGTPSGAPGILDFSVKPTIGLHFTSPEIQSNTFKSDTAVLWCDAPNPTGFSVFLSSIDEDTNLKHSESSITTQIPSITAPQFGNISTPQTWGYRIPNKATEGWKPIPKNSNPDRIYTTNYGGATKIGADFGVKASSNLTPGVYSKQVLFTAITNRVPTSATFITGPNVNDAIHTIDPGYDVKYFKKSNSAPANLATATVVSTTDSDVPIYLWYDASLKTIFWWSDADTVYANQNSNHMFDSLGDVEKIDMDGINTSRVKYMSYMFRSGKNLYKEINLASLDTSNVEDMSHMFATAGMKTMENLLPLDLSHFNTSKVKNMEGMFSGTFAPSLNIRSFDTSNVENMRLMFIDLNNVTDLDLSGWNVKKVNNIQALFVRDNKLKNLNLSGWELDSVTDMNSMFSGLSDLTSLNLTGFTTKNVTNMAHMFASTVKLADLDLSSFDTSKVTNMSGMFSNMQALNNINLSSFNTSNVTDMSSLFGNAVANPPISSLDLSNFDTSNVTNMAAMFQGLSNLTELKIQSFNTEKVTNMYRMFYWSFMTPANGTLDISNFDTRSLTNGEGMFQYMKVKTIYASPSFTTNLITSPMSFFMDNYNLTGANGTTWDYSKQDRVYARIDTPGNPGFFTSKP
jgi:hypothetical protein rflaF_14162